MKIILISLSLLIPLSSFAALKLSPQIVVNKVLSNSRQAEAIRLQTKTSEVGIKQARSTFDYYFILTPYYQVDQAEYLTQSSFPETRMAATSLSLSKKLSSGTNLTVIYENQNLGITQDQSAMVKYPNNRTLHSFQLELSQELLSNAFGFVDRNALKTAKVNQTAAKLRETENLEDLLLQSMELYWNTYVAKESLKEGIAAREKYARLVKTVQRKNRVGFASPGELVSAKAEYEMRVQGCKNASARYLELVDQLLTLLQIESQEDFDFEINEIIPAEPKMKSFVVDQMRQIQAAKYDYENAVRSTKSAKNQLLPTLNLQAQAASTGQDAEADKAFSEMSSGDKPTYYVGLQFEYPLSNDLNEAEYINQKTQRELANNQLKTLRDELVAKERSARKRVIALHAVAESSVRMEKLREQQVKEHEVSFKQGRLNLAELIRSYNALFASHTQKAQAIGNYHIALNRLAALRDELIKE
jgi:outer membrane protein TolC